MNSYDINFTAITLLKWERRSHIARSMLLRMYAQTFIVITCQQI